MDINNNQQQNTFESGMNTDTADFVLAKNQYRDARNVRLITSGDSNSAEIHFIEGNKYIGKLIDNTAYKVLATNSIRDLGVAVIQSGDGWNIITVKENADGGVECAKVFSTDITENLGDDDNIDTLMRYESSENIKLYIADSKHPLIVINVAETGQEGVTIDDIVSYPQADLNAPKFVDLVEGHLEAGLYQYAYRLYNKNGLASEMSRTTKLIPIVNVTGNGWSEGYEKETKTNRGIKISIPVGDTNLSKIYVYRIHYVENGQQPLIELIKDMPVQSNVDYTIVDMGDSSLGTLTLEEFNAVSGVHIIPKTIESKNDYLFAAGIKQQENTIDISDYDARTYSYSYDSSTGYYNVCVDGKNVEGTGFTNNSTAEEVETAVGNLVDISGTADCIQPNDAKYTPWIDHYYYNSDTNEVEASTVEKYYGGVGVNLRWRFVVTELDADYTRCLTSADEIEAVRKQDIVDNTVYNDTAIPAASHTHKEIIDSLYSNFGTQCYSADDPLNASTALPIGSNLPFIRRSVGQDQEDIYESYTGMKLYGIQHSILVPGTLEESDSNGWEKAYVGQFDEIPTNKYNYSNPKVSYLYKSLRRGETYRFGIIFYDKFGCASKAKWIQDITVPELYEPGFETFVSHGHSHTGTEIDLVVRPLGIEFQITNFPDNAVGYEIVRCNRNSTNIRNLAQGVLSKPVRRHSYYVTDVSSSVYCPTGYLTTARYMQGANNYYWARCHHGGDNVGHYRDNADNFDNFNTYQFVSAETTYQSESTQQLLKSVGKNNIKLQGLKYLFAQNQTQPLCFNTVMDTDSNDRYAYSYNASVIELGRHNTYMYLPQCGFTTLKNSSGSTYRIQRDRLHTKYCPSMCFLGLDVICDMYGAAQPSHRPFWRNCISEYSINNGLETHIQYLVDGYFNYRTNQYFETYQAGKSIVDVPQTQHTALQYIKLYEQTVDVTYRTPVVAVLSEDGDVTKKCLGFCVNFHSTGNSTDIYPKYNADLIDLAGRTDYSAINKSVVSDLNSTITNFCTAKTIDRQDLFKKPENDKLNQNLNNTTAEDSLQFFNATVGPVYSESLEDDCYKSGDYKWTLGWIGSNNDPRRIFSGDISLGGPCLLIKLAETEEDSEERHTFANTSAAYKVQVVDYNDKRNLISQGWVNLYPLKENCQPIEPGPYVGSTAYNIYDQSGKVASTHIYGAYGTYDTQATWVQELQKTYDQDGNVNGEKMQWKRKTVPIFRSSIAGTVLCNIQQTPVIYSGTTYAERELDTYYSYGDYHAIEDSKAVVFNGDCYIQPLEYVSAYKYSNPADYYGSENWYFLKTPMTKTVVYSIPVETNINIEYEYGYSVSRQFAEGGKQEDLANPELEPYTISGVTTQEKPMYQYNSVYSANPSAKLFSAYTEDDANESVQNADYRCYYSNVKENNEVIDSWTTFMSSNYLDVDTRYGGINKLRKFNNQLLFWQDSAFGLFSVNEQQLLQDVSNRNLILGEGGVLQRYDYISTIHGMRKDQITDTQSDRQLYWFDHDNNVILAYAQGGAVTELSTVKNVRSYLENIGDYNYYDKVRLTYDKKYKEVQAYIERGDGALVYNEDQQAFTALYDQRDFDAPQFIDLPTIKLGLSGVEIYKENTMEDDGRHRYGYTIEPQVTFICNDHPNMVKVFDINTFSGKFDNISSLRLDYSTPHNQSSMATGNEITNREWDYRVAIPRNDDAEYGNRLRDKTLKCTISSNNNSDDFSLEYVITKYRLSWS